MSFEKMEVLLRSNRLKFPMPDLIVTKLNLLVNDPNSSMDDIADMVQTNPVLAGKILQMANSAALRARSKTVNINDAIKRLGLMFVRDVSLALTLKSAFSGDDKLLVDVWDFSVRTASRMTILSSYLGCSSSMSMVAGLMHRIGELPVLAYNAEYKGGVQATDIDIQMLSARIVKDWKLPDEVYAAVHRDGKLGEMLNFTEAYLRKEVIEHSLSIGFQEFALLEAEHMDEINQFENVLNS